MGAHHSCSYNKEATGTESTDSAHLNIEEVDPNKDGTDSPEFSSAQNEGEQNLHSSTDPFGGSNKNVSKDSASAENSGNVQDSIDQANNLEVNLPPEIDASPLPPCTFYDAMNVSQSITPSHSPVVEQNSDSEQDEDLTNKVSVGGSVVEDDAMIPDNSGAGAGASAAPFVSKKAHSMRLLGMANSTHSFSHFNENDLPKEMFKQFTSDEQDSWGAAVDFDKTIHEWYVTEINPNGQFDRKGVKIGWRILEVNNRELTRETKDEIEDILMRGEACMILFERNEIKPKATKHRRPFSM